MAATSTTGESTSSTRQTVYTPVVYEITSGAPNYPETSGLDGPYTATNLSRSEYAVVRLMQSVRQVYREIGALYRRRSGAESPPSEEAMAAITSTSASAAESSSEDTDDFARIPGLSAAHTERLHIAGITSYEKLASISKDELTQLFASPMGEPVPDFDIWLVSARLLAAESDEVEA